MSKTPTNHGSITITGPDIPAFRMLVLKNALKLEIKGLRMSRGGSAYATIKKEFKLTGNKVNVLEKFETILRKKGVLVDAKK